MAFSVEQEEMTLQMTSKKVNSFKDFLAGGVGGACLLITGYPLDTIKVCLQTQPKPLLGQLPMYNGTFDCANKIIRKEGFIGLYKGMAAPLLTVTPIASISFFGYSVGKKLQTPSGENGHYTIPQLFAAGVLSAVFPTLIMTPSERIKCLLQIQHSTNERIYNGPVNCVKELYREGGIRNIYRGTVATLLREAPASGVYFATYEWFKKTLAPEEHSIRELSPLRTLFAGGMAGICNWLVAIPSDVLKFTTSNSTSWEILGHC